MHNRADLDRVRQQQKHDTVDDATVAALQEKESDLNGAPPSNILDYNSSAGAESGMFSV